MALGWETHNFRLENGGTGTEIHSFVLYFLCICISFVIEPSQQACREKGNTKLFLPQGVLGPARLYDMAVDSQVTMVNSTPKKKVPKPRSKCVPDRRK